MKELFPKFSSDYAGKDGNLNKMVHTIIPSLEYTLLKRKSQNEFFIPEIMMINSLRFVGAEERKLGETLERIAKLPKSERMVSEESLLSSVLNERLYDYYTAILSYKKIFRSFESRLVEIEARDNALQTQFSELGRTLLLKPGSIIFDSHDSYQDVSFSEASSYHKTLRSRLTDYLYECSKYLPSVN